jgi:hypothetical protein
VLSSGVFFGTVASLTPSKRGFQSKTYTSVQHATVRNLRPVMGFLLPASVVANLAMLVTTDHADTTARRGAVTGLLGPLASLLLTARWELPINAQVMTWQPSDPPADWRAHRNRWETVHLIRTATALFGLAGTLATIMSRPTGPRPAGDGEPLRRGPAFSRRNPTTARVQSLSRAGGFAAPPALRTQFDTVARCAFSP